MSYRSQTISSFNKTKVFNPLPKNKKNVINNNSNNNNNLTSVPRLPSIFQNNGATSHNSINKKNINTNLSSNANFSETSSKASKNELYLSAADVTKNMTKSKKDDEDENDGKENNEKSIEGEYETDLTDENEGKSENEESVQEFPDTLEDFTTDGDIGSIGSISEEGRSGHLYLESRKSSHHKLVRWQNAAKAGDYNLKKKKRAMSIKDNASVTSGQFETADLALKTSKLDKDSRFSAIDLADRKISASAMRVKASESKFMQLIQSSDINLSKSENEFIHIYSENNLEDEEEEEEDEESVDVKMSVLLETILSDDEGDQRGKDSSKSQVYLKSETIQLLDKDDYDKDKEKAAEELYFTEAQTAKKSILSANEIVEANRMLEEDDDGNLLNFDEIKANLKTRVFADRTCEADPKNGEQTRRRVRGLKFNPALLLTNYQLKDLFKRDEHGWAPIHYCAFRGFRQCIRIIHNEVPVMIEYRTKDSKLLTTPFLLAVMSLDLETIKLFIALGASISARDGLDHDAVQLCTYKQAIEIIKFFIKLDDPRLKVWNILVKSLKSENDYDALAAAKTLRQLTEIRPPWTTSCLWKPLYRKGITKYIALVLDAEYSDDVKIESLWTMLHIMNPDVKRVAVERHNILPVLIQLCLHENAVIADLSVLCLISILTVDKFVLLCIDTDLLKILINSLPKKRQPLTLKNTLDLMTRLLSSHSDFQNRFNLVEKSFQQVINRFVKNKSKMVAFSLVKVVEAAMKDHPVNQNNFAKQGLADHLVKLTKFRNRKLMVSTLAAVKAMCKDNPYSQKFLIEAEALDEITILLKKTRYLSIQELTASTLWTIGGKSFQNLWRIAEAIGVKVLVEFVESHSEILEFIGADGLAILNSAPLGVHDAFYACSGTQILTRLITRTNDRKTLLAAIKAIRHSCYKSALIKHPGNQKLAVGDYTVQGCVNLLLDIINKSSFKNPALIKAECIMALGSMTLVNPASLQELLNNKRFSFCLAINLLKSNEEDIRALGGQTLAIMCYNMTSTQSEIATLGGIYYCDFKKWMVEAKSDMNKCHFAFQLFVLARVFPDTKPAMPAAEGIVQLFEFLTLPSSDDFYKQESITAVVCKACDYIAALCHSRPGVPDSFIAIKTLDYLFNLLTSPFEQTRASAAIACGYLTFHPTAKRWLLRKFRQDTYLLDVLLFYTQDNKLNSVLLENWKYLEYVGVPPKDLSRGVLIRPRFDQLLSEPRPHILTGIEDPHSGVVGTSTVEKDDYVDELIYSDEPPQRNKILSSKLKVTDVKSAKSLTEPQQIPCLIRIQEERAKKQRELDEHTRAVDKLDQEHTMDVHDVHDDDDEEEEEEEDDEGMEDGYEDVNSQRSFFFVEDEEEVV